MGFINSSQILTDEFFCLRCAEGYFGQPSVPGGSCQPCQCNDNLDFSIPGSCDSLSGSCLICKPGTTGRYCELCADGYFGDAVDAKNCQRKFWTIDAPDTIDALYLKVPDEGLESRKLSVIHVWEIHSPYTESAYSKNFLFTTSVNPFKIATLLNCHCFFWWYTYFSLHVEWRFWNTLISIAGMKKLEIRQGLFIVYLNSNNFLEINLSAYIISLVPVSIR